MPFYIGHPEKGVFKTLERSTTAADIKNRPSEKLDCPSLCGQHKKAALCRIIKF